MNDEELLELAAKAAGIEIDFSIRGDFPPYYINAHGGHSSWNPLNHDGDALRLAVKLNFDLWNSDNYKSISAGVCPDGDMLKAKLHAEWKHKDPYAATRRAIVRAAAEIWSKL